MKTKILALSLFFSLSSQAGITLVSDLDDTIKITNAGNFAEATFNGFFTSKVYTGMPIVLEGARAYVNEVDIVTGSPPIIKGNIHRLYRKHNMRIDHTFLRNPLKEDIITFKVRVIKSLMDASPDQFIFFGDDVDKDHVIYDKIKTEYGDRVLAAYIHVVKGREVPSTVTRYYTSADLLLRESLAGRMPEATVRQGLDALMAETNVSHIFPKFAECPSAATSWEWQTQTIFAPTLKPLTDKLITYCQDRSKPKPNVNDEAPVEPEADPIEAGALAEDSGI